MLKYLVLTSYYFFIYKGCLQLIFYNAKPSKTLIALFTALSLQFSWCSKNNNEYDTVVPMKIKAQKEYIRKIYKVLKEKKINVSDKFKKDLAWLLARIDKEKSYNMFIFINNYFIENPDIPKYKLINILYILAKENVLSDEFSDKFMENYKAYFTPLKEFYWETKLAKKLEKLNKDFRNSEISEEKVKEVFKEYLDNQSDEDLAIILIIIFALIIPNCKAFWLY